MKRTTLFYVTVFALFTFVLSACGMTTSAPTEEAPVVQTANAMAADLQAGLTATAILAPYTTAELPTLAQSVSYATHTPGALVLPTATLTPAVITINNRALLIGGRLDQNGEYFMYTAEINPELLKKGTSLQQYLEMVTTTNFINACYLDKKIEIFNDGVKIVVTDGRAFFMPDDGETVPHSAISWIQYVPEKGILVCSNDKGLPGTWDGVCDGNTQWVTEWISFEELLKSGKFQPWAAPFAQVAGQFDGIIFNGKIEVLEVHR